MTFKTLCVWQACTRLYTHKKNPEKWTQREEKTSQAIYWVRHNWTYNQNMYPAQFKKLLLLRFCRVRMLLKPDRHMVSFPVKSPWFYLKNPVLFHLVYQLCLWDSSPDPGVGQCHKLPVSQHVTVFKPQRWTLRSPWDAGYSKGSLTPGPCRA